MKPEMILQSDLLDIIFHDRNKAYGAYMLRKHYGSRLRTSMALMSALVLCLSVLWFVHANSQDATRSIVAGQPVDDVTIKPFEEVPKKIEKAKPLLQPKQVAQIKNPTFKIVPDELADKPMPTIDELADKQIGLIDKPGDAASSGDLLPPSDGVAGGTEIAAPVKPAVVEITKPLHVADVMPEFPGGREAFMRFMLRNLREPDDLDEGQKIVVIVQFVVAADGTISDAKIMQSGGRYDAEVLRVVKKMPRWKAGMQNGTSVPVYFKLPVTFQSSN